MNNGNVKSRVLIVFQFLSLVGALFIVFVAAFFVQMPPRHLIMLEGEDGQRIHRRYLLCNPYCNEIYGHSNSFDIRHFNYNRVIVSRRGAKDRYIHYSIGCHSMSSPEDLAYCVTKFPLF